MYFPTEQHAAPIVVSSGVVSHLTFHALANALLKIPADGDDIDFLIRAIFIPSTETL